ncbi:MAG: response regulator [Thermodesulfobacteriota bacterium]|nr:response regulator [Thermodesulfobacteriota bacterium]
MIKSVLLVDDEQEMLLSLKEGLEKYADVFSVLLAKDGEDALEKLKQNPVSLVVTDLKMPRMDGFTLLTHVMVDYPDIPVIIITAHSIPIMVKMAKKVGALGYIEKPFMVEDLAQRIIAALRDQSDGGTLHSASSGLFLQLIEMERKTCTIRLVNKSSGRRGVLFFRDGILLDARIDGLRGEAAANEILSWDDVILSIQNECSQKEKKIEGDLQAILLEAMRLKDEAAEGKDAATTGREDGETQEAATVINQYEEKTAEIPGFNSVKKKLEGKIGDRRGVEDIYQDSSWDGLISQVAEVGEFLDAGRLKLCYVNEGESKDFILLPGDRTTVISLNPDALKGWIIEVLSR